MFVFKGIVNKFFCYAGMIVLLLCFFCISWGSFLRDMEGNMVLIALSVFLLTALAVISMRFYTSLAPQKLPDVQNSSILIRLSILAFIAMGVRAVTFILIDFNLMSQISIAVYISAALNTVLIYCIATRIWRHSCGMIAAVIYSLWGGCEMLFVSHYEELGISLACSLAAQSFALAAILFLYLSVATRGHNAAIFCCVVSGVATGCAVALDGLYFPLILCVITYYLVNDTRMRRKKIWQKRPYAIRKATFIVMHIVLSLLAFAVLTLVLRFTFQVPFFSALRSFSLISPDGFRSVFKEVDTAFSSAAGILLMARSYFANYIQLLVLAVLLLLSVFGAFAAVKKNNLRSMILAETVVFMVSFSLVFGVLPHAFIAILPFVLLLAIGGMYSAGEFSAVIKKAYGGRTRSKISERAESQMQTFVDEKAALMDRTIEPKPEPADEIEESEEEEGTGSDYFFSFNTESTSVASGDDRQSLLQSLADVKENNTKENHN